MKFSSIQELLAQIKADIALASNLLTDPDCSELKTLLDE